jgi:hypothetical protein
MQPHQTDNLPRCIEPRSSARYSLSRSTYTWDIPSRKPNHADLPSKLIQTMRAALDEVMTKIPVEQATAGIGGALAGWALRLQALSFNLQLAAPIHPQ